MTKIKSYTIRLLNKTHTIKCPEAEFSNLERAAERLNESWHEQRKKYSLDTDAALLMAALHLSHEGILLEEQRSKQREQMAGFISALEKKIHHVVGES